LNHVFSSQPGRDVQVVCRWKVCLIVLQDRVILEISKRIQSRDRTVDSCAWTALAWARRSPEKFGLTHLQTPAARATVVGNTESCL
jgi:hypothetical protein